MRATWGQIPIRGLVAAVLVVGLAACGGEEVGEPEASESTAEASPPEPVSAADDTAALEALLGEKYADFPGHGYFLGETDLDGDGVAEAVVHVVGPMLCGSGGCSTLVLARVADGYREIAEIGPGRPPIQALDRTSNGWRNLLVHVSGGGVPEGYEAELEFDGETYPRNPTVEPAKKAADTEGAEMLVPEFESMVEGREIPTPSEG